MTFPWMPRAAATGKGRCLYGESEKYRRLEGDASPFRHKIEGRNSKGTLRPKARRRLTPSPVEWHPVQRGPCIYRKINQYEPQREPHLSRNPGDNGAVPFLKHSPEFSIAAGYYPRPCCE